MNRRRLGWGSTVLALIGTSMLLAGSLHAEQPWLVLEGKQGPGAGKHIVLVSGDEEYRSEESLPQLAKILATRHGFKCTVLFAVNKETGDVDPMTNDNIPGLEALRTADLMVMLIRFRELPDAQMKHIVDYIDSGKPIVGMRTATHAFSYAKHKDSPYAKYSWRDANFDGGFGRQVLGETWISHYGKHEKESTRGIVAPGMEKHPLTRGLTDIWGPSDVYEVKTLSGDSKPVILGQVLTGMNPTDPVNTQKPALPIAWIKTYTGAQGKASRVFTTTMGHAHDLKNEGVRRMLVNACYWGLGMEDQIAAKSNVDIVGVYDPLPIHNKKHRQNMKPADFAR